MTNLLVEPHPDDPLHQRSGPGMAWSLANSSEALPGVLTTLAWTCWQPPFNFGVRRAYAALGVLSGRDVIADEDPLENFGAAFYGRYTGSVELARRFADRMPWMSARQVDVAVFGAERTTRPSHHSRRRYPVIAVRMPLAAALIGRRLARLRRDVDAWWLDAAWTEQPWPPGLAQRRLAEAIERLEDVLTAQCTCMYLFQTAMALVGRVVAGTGHTTAEAVSGRGRLEEADLVEDAWRLARGELDRPTFLRRHGFHGPREGAIDTPSWREDPSTLDSYVTALQRRADDAAPSAAFEQRALAGARARAEVYAALPAHRRALARALIGCAQTLVPLRETGKGALLQILDVLRAAARARGHELAAAGVLAEPDDAFHLSADEFRAATPRSDLRPLVEWRRARRQQFLAIELPTSWIGDPVPVPARSAATPPGAAGGTDEAEADADVTRTGLGVSVGSVSGRARVLLEPDATDLEPDEILVCRTTDPAWAPLLYLSAGLVMELGGTLSHGAIIARELGVPSVVNVPDATSWLATGDRVTIDGTTGVIDRIERANARVSP